MGTKPSNYVPVDWSNPDPEVDEDLSAETDRLLALIGEGGIEYAAITSEQMDRVIARAHVNLDAKYRERFELAMEDVAAERIADRVYG